MKSMTPTNYLEKYFSCKAFPNGNKAALARAFGKHSTHSNKIFLEYATIEYFVAIYETYDVIMRRVKNDKKYVIITDIGDKRTVNCDTLYTEYGVRYKCED